MYQKIIKEVTLIGLILAGLIACTPIAHTNPSQAIVYNQHAANTWWPFQRSNDLWSHFHQDSRIMDASAIPRVQKEIRGLVRNKANLERAIQKGSPYLFHIYQETQKHQLPVELALLPIMESDYNPFAYSKVGAAGLWQLMPSVAHDFRVKSNPWFEGRRDIITSTHVALSHFSYLHRYFKGDLLLALAAYDSGKIRVTRAMEFNNQNGLRTDFWSLPLPRETQNYVPRLLALATIINNPEKYGIKLPNIKYEPYLTQIALKSQPDLTKVAKLAELNPKYMYALNPGLNHWATDPNGPHKLVLPLENAEILQRNLANNETLNFLPSQSHNVPSSYAPGETVQLANITPPTRPAQQNVVYVGNRTSIGIIRNDDIAINKKVDLAANHINPPQITKRANLAKAHDPHIQVATSNRSIINKSQHNVVKKHHSRHSSLQSRKA